MKIRFVTFAEREPLIRGFSNVGLGTGAGDDGIRDEMWARERKTDTPMSDLSCYWKLLQTKT